MLATAALILMAGVAGAIFDDGTDIDPDSPKYDGSAGYVYAEEESSGSGVYLMCNDIMNDFQIGCDSTHPDSVNLTPKQGKTDQKKRDNNAYAWIWADEIGGIDEDNTTFELTCDRVQMTGKANDDKFTAEARCTLSKCDIPGGLTVDQVIAMGDCIDDAEDSGNIGKGVSTLRLDNKNQLKGNIKSKGGWD
ncbi:MAG: hypothetical protein JRD03_10885 [Deltaproteobacteria bacterium]|nr:hypothetical protein [Deltaproteobacteria bacterium]